jgi:hypothetical protein
MQEDECRRPRCILVCGLEDEGRLLRHDLWSFRERKGEN